MLSREQWLAERRKGIGGSDISAILGVNDYTTPYQLWLDKTGRSENQAESQVMRRGKILEPAVVEFWREESGYEIVPGSDDPYKIDYHKDYRFLFGTPDRMYIDENGNKGALECKTTLINIDTDELPHSWFCQVQWYMGIMGCDIGEVSCLGKFFKVDRVPYNFVPDFFNTLVEKAVEFWEKNILADIPPDPINSEDIKTMFRKHVDGKFIEATPATVSLVTHLKTVKTQIKELEAQEQEIAEQIKMILRDSEGIQYENRPLITWKAANPSNRFDADSFKSAHPDIYNQFQKTVPGSRRFLVK